MTLGFLIKFILLVKKKKNPFPMCNDPSLLGGEVDLYHNKILIDKENVHALITLSFRPF